MNFTFDPKIPEQYFSLLDERSKFHSPISAWTISVPDNVLKRKLPHLTKERYLGASHRVWRKLLNNFPSNEDTQSPEPTPPPDETTES